MPVKSYNPRMKSSYSISPSQLTLYTTLALVAAAATGATFAAWFNHGDTIFLSLIQAGLSWCM
ncbi:hypothetical protein DEV92_101129 [Phyllobacterium myrsinacearum]|uniref:Uncharacterized protein n=2 Tax=Phyllobacterium myrsinacearum TaxID=28101 RepID=A0A2S9JXA6_9HYPH|nr:hypothetical protein C5750_02155 [Phyllobacterium myrsinacearum]PWV96152.1 hypothetical protein DEV92_101129 [Phyllobacterium myrsinacearum]RZV09858.1 hypothetical protein EV654_0959 [Phyllobacterium myrsinacearum]